MTRETQGDGLAGCARSVERRTRYRSQRPLRLPHIPFLPPLNSVNRYPAGRRESPKGVWTFDVPGVAVDPCDRPNAVAVLPAKNPVESGLSSHIRFSYLPL